MSQENNTGILQFLRDHFAKQETAMNPGSPVVGTPANETIPGSAGNDVLIGGGGSDKLMGAGGNDVVVSGDPATPPVTPPVMPSVAPTAGVPPVTPPVMPSVAPIASPAGVPPMTPPVSLDPVGAVPTPPQTAPANGVDGAPPVVPAGVTPVTAEQLNSFFIGKEGTDVLQAATAKASVLVDGGQGDDQLTTGSGADTVKGGEGNDFIDGKGGKDYLFGDGGDDRIVWNNGDGSDVVDGGAGKDISETTGGADPEFFTLSDAEGGATLNRIGQKPFHLDLKSIEQVALNGQAGADILDVSQLDKSGVQEVKFDGGADNDILSGQGSNASLIGIGGAGDDFLIGGNKADIFKGDAGNDVIAGGAGADKFVFDTGTVFDTAHLGSDTLTDFMAGEDKIVLNKGTFAALQSQNGSGFSNGNEFAAVATDDLAAASGSLIVYSQGSGKLFYNSNGVEAGLGRGAEFASLQGAPVLTAADFVIENAHTPVAV